MELAQHVKAKLKEQARKQGIPCVVTCRAKSLRSFSAKLVQRLDVGNYSDVRDRAGVRVVVPYLRLLEGTENLIKSLFDFGEQDRRDRREENEPNVFEYRATHFWVTCPDVDDILLGKECEIQLLTRAESMWADAEHDVSYKSVRPPPNHIRRAYYRLAALMEIFDLEIQRLRHEMENIDDLPGARLLSALEPYHREFVGGGYNGRLSGLVLDLLTEQVILDPVDSAISDINAFIQANRGRLTDLLAQYEDDDYANPLIWQPELPAILFCLDNRWARIQEYWTDAFPIELLKSLGTDWSVPVYE